MSAGKNVAKNRDIGDMAKSPILTAISRDTSNKQAEAFVKIYRVLYESVKLNGNKQLKNKDKVL